MFTMVRVWGQGEHLHPQRLAWFRSPTDTKGTAPKLSGQLVQVWDTRSEEGSEA